MSLCPESRYLLCCIALIQRTKWECYCNSFYVYLRKCIQEVHCFQCTHPHITLRQVIPIFTCKQFTKIFIPHHLCPYQPGSSCSCYGSNSFSLQKDQCTGALQSKTQCALVTIHSSTVLSLFNSPSSENSMKVATLSRLQGSILHILVIH